MTHRAMVIGGWATVSGYMKGLAVAVGPSHSPEVIDWRDCLNGSGGALATALRESPDRATLIGWSAGAQIALEAALAAPERVKGLVLISAAARLTSHDEYDGVAPRALRAMKRKMDSNREDVVRDFFANCIAPRVDESAVADLCRQAGEIDTAALAEGLDYLARTDLRAKLESVTAPALVIHGDADMVVPPSCGKYLAGELPSATFIAVQGAGHDLPGTSAGELAKHMKDWGHGHRS